MEKLLNNEKSVEKSERPQNKNLKPFTKWGGGHRAKGQKNYATLRREAIIEIGKLNNKTPEEIEIMLHSKGLSEALKGNYQFYKDDLDRLHGTAQNNVNLTAEITKIVSIDE